MGAIATLNLRIAPRRMLKPGEAAEYCGRSLKRFRAECPVRPVVFENGDELYDIHDLDGWLDSRKAGQVDATADAIVARL